MATATKTKKKGNSTVRKSKKNWAAALDRLKRILADYTR